MPSSQFRYEAHTVSQGGLAASEPSFRFAEYSNDLGPAWVGVSGMTLDLSCAK